jgi:sugar lactone lactonase YvrE
VRRFLVGEVERVEGVPSHLVFDQRTRSLYVVDTGNARILRLDPNTGRNGEPMRCDDDQLDFEVPVVEGASFEVVVAGGSLELPSGIALLGGALYVSDNATSRITAFTLDGREIASLDTGLPAGTLAGIAIGPDGRLYFTDMKTSAIRRIEPR